jgi:hypothetical protein
MIALTVHTGARTFCYFLYLSSLQKMQPHFLNHDPHLTKKFVMHSIFEGLVI